MGAAQKNAWCDYEMTTLPPTAAGTAPAPPPAPVSVAVPPKPPAASHELNRPRPAGAALPPRPPKKIPQNPPPTPDPLAELLATIRDLHRAVLDMHPVPAAPRIAPPCQVHLSASASSAAQTEFDVDLDLPFKSLMGATVYLTEFSMQGADPLFPVAALGVSIVRPSMHSSAQHSNGKFFVGTPSATGLPVQAANNTVNSRVAQGHDFPARLMGTLTASRVRGVVVTLEALIPQHSGITDLAGTTEADKGSFRPIWRTDDDLNITPPTFPLAGGTDLAAFNQDAALARCFHVVLTIVPPAL